MSKIKGFLSLITCLNLLNAVPVHDKKELMKGFAPRIIFNASEKFFPGSVETFILKSSLVDKDGKVLIPKNELELSHFDKIITQVYNNPSYAITLEKDDPYKYGECPKNNRVTAPCYAHWIDKDDNRAVIQYMFFYPTNGSRFFNEVRFLGYHEGDWEHIDVHLKKNVNDYSIEKVFYAQHSQQYGQYVNADDLKSFPVPGKKHPMVYAAYGSHASFPRVTCFFNPTFDRIDDDGVVWNCFDNIVNVGTYQDTAPAQEWIKFKGRWGFGGPPTPSFQAWWREKGEQYYDLARIKLTDDLINDIDTPTFSLSIPKRIQRLRWLFEEEKNTSAHTKFYAKDNIDLFQKGILANRLIFNNIYHGQITSVPKEQRNLFLKGSLPSEFAGGRVYLKIQGVEE